MKRTLSLLLALSVSVFITAGCSKRQSPTAGEPAAIAQDDDYSQASYKVEAPLPVLQTHPEAAVKWSQLTHKKIVAVAAAKWGLSTARVNNITAASEMPDVYQSGFSNGYNQQWSHAFMLTSGGYWYWGDADDDFYDNLNQSGGEIESPEGYNGKSAKYYYQASNQYQGDWYVGYACHYIEDVCLVLHTTVPGYYMATKHFDFETWVENNLTAGHKLLDAVSADNTYYIVTDPKTAINQAAYYTSGYYSSAYGKKAWDAYAACGYPTAAGSGNATLVANTRGMLVDAGRYVKGTIKYTLDKYGQWTSRY
jgi:hypothetical protein